MRLSEQMKQGGLSNLAKLNNWPSADLKTDAEWDWERESDQGPGQSREGPAAAAQTRWQVARYNRTTQLQLQYCKTENFRLHFNLAKFANFVNSRKLSACANWKVYEVKVFKKSMYTSVYNGKQRILSASEMSKTKNRKLLVQRIFHAIQ